MKTSLADARHSRRLLIPRTGRFVAVLLVGCALFSGCGRAAPPPGDGAVLSPELQKFQGLKGKIAIAGGTAHIPVMNAAVQRIHAANPDIRITVAGGGSGVGIKKVGEGLVEIGNTGRDVTAQEKETYGLVTFPFALDGVAIIVHPSNPVAGLTAVQMKRIYATEITDWKEVGGPEGKINLFTRDEASGTREVFWELVLGKGTIAPSANVVASTGAMKLAVARDPLAIGYNAIGHLDETVKAVPLDGQAPTQENAASGQYRVVRKLSMNTRGQPSELVQAFIDYVRGPAGAVLIREAGYLPVQE